MGCGDFVLDSQSPRWCFSTEDYNERLKGQPITIEEKIFLVWCYLPYSDVFEQYREFTNNMCPYRFTHKVPLSCVNCEKVYIDYFCS